MSGEKFLCWTDSDNKRFYAPVSTCMVSIPGRRLPSGTSSATVYIIGGTIIDVNMQTQVAVNTTFGSSSDTTQNSEAYENYAISDTSPGSIFTVPTFYEALEWVKTGRKNKALYGTEVDNPINTQV